MNDLVLTNEPILINDKLINQSGQKDFMLQTDPVWLTHQIHVLEVRICFLSSAACPLKYLKQ